MYIIKRGKVYISKWKRLGCRKMCTIFFSSWYYSKKQANLHHKKLERYLVRFHVIWLNIFHIYNGLMWILGSNYFHFTLSLRCKKCGNTLNRRSKWKRRGRRKMMKYKRTRLFVHRLDEKYHCSKITLFLILEKHFLKSIEVNDKRFVEKHFVMYEKWVEIIPQYVNIFFLP